MPPHEMLHSGELDQVIVGPDASDTTADAAIVSRKHAELLRTNNMAQIMSFLGLGDQEVEGRFL